MFLAHYLEYAVGSADFAWWRLRQVVPRYYFKSTGMLVVGLGLVVFPKPTPGSGLGTNLSSGLTFGVALGLIYGLGTVVFDLRMLVTSGAMPVRVVKKRRVGVPAPSRGIRVSVGGLGGGARDRPRDWDRVGLLAGFNAGQGAGSVPARGWVGAGIGGGIVFGLVFGLVDAGGDLAAAASPRAVLARDRQAALLLILTFGLAAGLGAGSGPGSGPGSGRG